tara:strand:- start:701 stop:1375 length:675 start_codon:yes stop_codon:yes gene_type:complete
MILKAKDLSKSYIDGSDKLCVLEKLNFEISEPEIVVINGPSGSGKTTLLNIFSTLDAPDSGVLEINGSEIMKCTSREINSIRSKQIGILFQTHHLLPEFTVLENLEMPFSINDIEDHHEPSYLLKEFNLYDKASKFPSDLSGGECQRIALLRAIINKPKLVLADEPTANLDKKNLYIMIELIKKMKINYNMTFVIATHDERLCDLADKIYYLNSRKLTIDKTSD